MLKSLVIETTKKKFFKRFIITEYKFLNVMSDRLSRPTKSLSDKGNILYVGTLGLNPPVYGLAIWILVLSVVCYNHRCSQIIYSEHFCLNYMFLYNY